MVVRVFSVGVPILILFMVFSPFLEADTFKWIEDDGKVHYSDEPLKSKDSEWVEDEEKSYFSYQQDKKLESGNSPVLPSRNAPPKTSLQQNKVGQNYGKALGGGGSAPQTPTAESYSRQSSRERISTRGNSTRLKATERASTRGNSPRQTATERTSTRSNAANKPSTERTSTRSSSAGQSSRRGSTRGY